MGTEGTADESRLPQLRGTSSTDRRHGERRLSNIEEWTEQLNQSTQQLSDRLVNLTDALSEIGRVQERQMKLELDLREAHVETVELNELVVHEHERRQRRTYVFIVVVSVLSSLIVLGIGALAYNAIKPTPSYDPFNFPLQTVSDRYGGATTPAVHIGDDVHVHAVKCSSAKHAVPATGSTVWTTTLPQGSSIVVTTASSSSVAPGCIAHDYDNPMPATVVARTKQLYADGAKRVTWTINGVQRPLKAGGVGEGWQTEPFDVIP